MISSSQQEAKRTSDLEMEKILHKLLELVQQDIKLGCGHCEKIFNGALEKEANN